MYSKIINLSVAIILASCLSFSLESNNHLAFAADLNQEISQSGNNEQINQPRSYRVRLGDTLRGIANQLDISVSQIVNYNPHLRSRPDLIYVGEIINLDPRTPLVFRNLPEEIRQSDSESIGSCRRCPHDEYCTQEQKPMRAIAPKNGLGYTFDDYPYFFWYFPGIESGSVPISLELIGSKMIEVNDQFRTIDRATLYTTSLNLERAGIIAFQLPSDYEPLQEEQEYTWRINIQCTPETSMYLNYSIKRLSTDNLRLTRKLENASVDEHPAIYAESGVWFDALKMIALQLKQTPDDPTLHQDWHNILRLIGLQNLINEPIQYIHWLEP